MDSVARQTAMKELCHFAREHPDRQFIFLTPNSLSGIAAANDLRIHHMANPRDRDTAQRTLTDTAGFTRA
jgi:hypothetical protein